MKSRKKLIIGLAILLSLSIIGIAVAAYTVWTPISSVSITSHSDNDIVFAGNDVTLTCSTSTDNDCNTTTQQVEADTVTHTWSGAGTFDPTTGTSVTWTVPSSEGDVNITVTADDSPLADDTAKTDTVTLTVQNIIYVDTDATGDDDGTTWANAFNDLQDALDAATYGNEIWVAEGTYKPSTETDANDARTATFNLIDGASIYGGFDPTTGDDLWSERDYANNETILSGDIGTVDDVNDNSYHVVMAIVDSNTNIDGFTITKGRADYISYGNDDGGGIINHDGGAGSTKGSPTIANCKFSDNYANSYGGGVCLDGSDTDVSITNCAFIDNDSNIYGGGLYFYGTVSISDCLFSGNSAGWGGGGLAALGTVINSPDLEMESCVFYSNQETGIRENYDYGGGGLFMGEADGNMVNCVFVGNSVSGNGGAILVRNDNETFNIINCTIYDNDANNGGGLNTYMLTNAVTNVTNCIFWGNDANDSGNQIHNELATTATVTYCDIEGSYSGTGNINSDPNFVDRNDPDGNDDVWATTDDGLALSSSSPCIDAANGNVDPTTDILGNSRYDDSSTTDTGIGSPTYVDIGAYEYQG